MRPKILTPFVFAVLLCLTAASLYSQTPFKGCPAKGTAKSKKNQAQNVLKNRGDAPTPTEIDESTTLRDLLLKANDKKFDPETAVEITGFVVDVTPGGKKETCNCGRKDLQDIHIDVVQRRSHAENKRQHFIVEITPRWQGELGNRKAVSKEIKGRSVKFTGFLFYDSIHAEEAENTAPGRKGNWRKTAWEVHPVTSFEVVDDSQCP